MTQIVVTPKGEGCFAVQVQEKGLETSHEVTVPPSFLDELGIGGSEQERVVRESFQFLLEREPSTSIMGEFDLPVISRYFADYPEEIKRRLA